MRRRTREKIAPQPPELPDDLKPVTVHAADVSSGSESAGACFDRCELRGCTLEGLRGAERLRGVAMPWEDIVASAGLFAAALGVSILDAGDG